VAWPLRLGDGAGVSASLKGCAADVDVAGGGVRGDEAEVTVCEMGVAFPRREEVLRKRVFRGEDRRAAEATRRQFRQIILGGLGLKWRC
jgi:hypothetical protein